MTDAQKIEVLRKALENALPIISDRAAGGRMLTPRGWASEVFREARAALDATKE